MARLIADSGNNKERKLEKSFESSENVHLQQCHLPYDLAHVGGGKAKLVQYALEAGAVAVGHFELIDYDILIASALGVDVLQELSQLAGYLLYGVAAEGLGYELLGLTVASALYGEAGRAAVEDGEARLRVLHEIRQQGGFAFLLEGL